MINRNFETKGRVITLDRAKKSYIAKCFFVFLIISALVFSSFTSTSYQAKGDKEDVEVAEGFDPWTIQEKELQDVVSEISYFDIKEDYENKISQTEGLVFNAKSLWNHLKTVKKKRLAIPALVTL